MELISRLDMGCHENGAFLFGSVLRSGKRLETVLELADEGHGGRRAILRLASDQILDDGLDE